MAVILTVANAGQATGIGGTFSGVSAINANGAIPNSVGGSGLTYALDNTIANKGSADSVTWTGIQNISDATGTVNFGTGGSVGGGVTAQTLNYSTYGSPVSVTLAAVPNAGAATSDVGWRSSSMPAKDAMVAVWRLAV